MYFLGTRPLLMLAYNDLELEKTGGILFNDLTVSCKSTAFSTTVSTGSTLLSSSIASLAALLLASSVSLSLYSSPSGRRKIPPLPVSWEEDSWRRKVRRNMAVNDILSLVFIIQHSPRYVCFIVCKRELPVSQVWWGLLFNCFHSLITVFYSMFMFSSMKRSVVMNMSRFSF